MRATLPLSVLLLALAAPIAAIAADDVPADAVVGTLPFLEVEEPNRIYLELAEPDASPFRLLLDTGATHVLLSPLAARAAGVSVRTLKDTPYRRKTGLGRDIQFYVDKQSGLEYGLIGGDFLKQFVVELDFAARVVRFLDPRRYSLRDVPAAPDQAVLALRDSPRPIVTISLGGHEVPVMVDTGMPWPIELSGKTARSVGIDVESLPPFATTRTVRGEVETRIYEAPELSIGGFVFRNVPVLIAPNGSYNLGGETSDSTIGYDLLSRFLVRFDYGARRMLLRRQSEQVVYYGVDYAVARATGAFVAPWGAIGHRVIFVFPDSPAAKRGLRADDFLVRGQSSDTAESMLRALAAGKPVQVKRDLGDGLVDVALEPGESPAKP